MSRLVQLNVEVPFEQRAEFNQLLETAHRQCQDLNDKLHLLHLLIPGITSRAITIVRSFLITYLSDTLLSMFIYLPPL